MIVVPEDLMNILFAPFADKANLWRASIEMLHSRYHQNPNHPQVKEAQFSMEQAISQWSDEQVRDFVVNHFLEPPHSIEFQTKSSAELREFLVEVYHYIFQS